MKRGQFGTRTIWHRSVKGTIWHRDVSEEEMQFQDEREILCQMEDKYFVKYLEILTLSQHLEERRRQVLLCSNNMAEHLSQPSARRAHRHPPTVIYPPNVGRIYPIQIYLSY